MTGTNWIIFGLAIMILASAKTALAGYGPPVTDSTVDPSILIIDDEYLGVKVDGDYALIDEKDREFELGELMGKPLVLVLSYYTCDGSCMVQNHLLKNRLLGIERVRAGADYNVLTLSFDKNDDGKSLEMFAGELGLPAGLSDGWRLALLKNKEDIKRLTGTVGFKYFWSARDRVFLHPSVFIFLSPEGRVLRHLYAPSIEKKDIELAILETGKGVSRGSKVTDLTDLFLVACFSYNFKEGKYTLNYPLFIAVGAFLLGVSVVVASLTVFKLKGRREGHG
jgi:protein SCO1/2